MADPAPTQNPSFIAGVAPDAAAAIAAPQSGQGALTYDPSNPQPYQPEQLPPVQANVPAAAALPPQQQVQDMGATNHAGGVAYMLDQGLRGFMQGRAVQQQQQAVKLAKQQQALTGLVNTTSERLYSMAQAGVDPNSKEFQDAQGQVQAAWQAQQNFIGQHIQGQTTDKKTGKTKPKQANLLQRMFQSDDPAAVPAAWYEASQKLGPPVLWQIKPFLTPQYRQKLATQQGTAATTEQGNQVAAQDKLEQAKQALQYSQVTGKPQADWTDTDKAFVDQYDSLHGKATDELLRARGELAKWIMAHPNATLTPAQQELLTGKSPSATGTGTTYAQQKREYAASIGKTPDEMTFDDEKEFQEQLTESKRPPETTTATHTIIGMQGNQQVPIQVETTTTRGFGAALPRKNPSPTTNAPPKTTPAPRQGNNAGVVDVGTPVGWKPDAALNQAKSAAQNLNTIYGVAKTYVDNLTPTTSNSLSLAYVQSNNQFGKSGIRMSNAEINRSIEAAKGSIAERIKAAGWKAGVGTLPPDVAKDMLTVIKLNNEAAQQGYAKILAQESGTPAPAGAVNPAEHKVGDVVVVNGQHVRITAIDANGKATGEVLP